MNTKHYKESDDGRICSQCKEHKPWTDYNKGGVAGHKSFCRQCQKKIEANYIRDIEKRRAASLRAYYKRKELANEPAKEEEDPTTN